MRASTVSPRWLTERCSVPGVNCTKLAHARASVSGRPGGWRVNVWVRVVIRPVLCFQAGGLERLAVRVGKRARLLHRLESRQEPASLRNLRLELTRQTADSCTLPV